MLTVRQKNNLIFFCIFLHIIEETQSQNYRKRFKINALRVFFM